MSSTPRRRGPAPRLTQEQLVDAAVDVVEAEGFSALSLRSVARRLQVGPMTLYTYVAGSEELAALVVDRLIQDAVRDLALPADWRGVLRLLAARLEELVTAHPAMVEAFGLGMVRGGSSAVVAREVVDRLLADGLTRQQALDGYLGVHALVLGCAVIRPGAAGLSVDALVERLLDGLAAGAAGTGR